MRTVKFTRLVASMLFGVAAVSAPFVGAAHAQKVNPPIDPNGSFVESWALAPTGEDPSQPSSRGTLSYTADPGGTVDDSVTLWNYSSTPVTFHIYPTDAFNNEQGVFSLLRANEPAKDLGTWITTGTSSITVPGRTSATIPVKVTVPEGATPGDHAAAILAAATAVAVDGQGHQVSLERRTGTRVYLRVRGTIDPSLVVQDLSTKYHGSFNPLDGSLDVHYTVANEGNVRLGARQRLVVKDIFGRTVATKDLDPIDELLPGNAVSFDETISGVPAAISVKTTVELTPTSPRGVNDQPPPATSASTRAWAIPWSVLLVIVLALLAWRLYRRWRDREAEPLPPPERPAVGTSVGR